MTQVPDRTPRPAGEEEALLRYWAPPKGLNAFTAVNNTYIGLYYVGAAILFFVLGGILAVLMRSQLAFPSGDLLNQSLYNQIFTMHGTVMMFLFAVPAVEAMGVLLLPNMQAARDLPFPRLSAYAFWAYLIGGLVFFCSLFVGLAPDGGWFMYPPLTSYQYSPGSNADFWLLGIGFIEISAIAGAIEIIVGVLRTRAPGMTLDRMPVYAWAMLVFAGMIIFAFPAIILATLLLELERAFHWPFFIAGKGGDPLLWQHLFWFFGHPEVYIIFLPAAGMVSMILPTMAQVPLVGYRYVVLALVSTGFLSFGLWVHHMFTTGMPKLSMSLFSVASMAVAVPSGVQVFAWIATLAAGRLRLTVPALFILGFLFIFVLGGLTGVMVGMMPFDWQAHDTYFIVAHLHYVLIGGMVFPLFAAFYYWAPSVSRRSLSERLGRWAFWLMFIGVNLTFFPMHIAGLRGMPRRVYTYPADLGWDLLNLLSSLGAYVIAAGVAFFLLDVARNFRISIDRNPGNIWNAGTLEWLPNDVYGTRSIPRISSRYPLWDQPGISEDVEDGRYYLPGAPTEGRETIVTSPVEAEPQYLQQVPGPSWWPVLGAIGTAGFFLLLTVKLVIPAAAFGLLAVVSIIRWLWETDPGPNHPPADIGGGIRLPVYITGPASHAWWAMVVLLIVVGMIFGCLIFSYLFLWSINPGKWPPSAVELPQLGAALWPTLLYLAAAVMVAVASRTLGHRMGRQPLLPAAAILGAGILLSAASLLELRLHWDSGLRPQDHSYGAVVYTISAIQIACVMTSCLMLLYCIARLLTGKMDDVRRSSFDMTMLFGNYTAAQGLAGLAVTHLLARLLGAT